MGFWSNVWSSVKSVAKDVASDVAKATKYVGSKIEQAGNWIEKKISGLGKKKSSPTWTEDLSSSGSQSTSSSGYSSNSTNLNEEKKKQEILKENEAIANYQAKVEKDANSREEAVKNLYLEIYDGYISDFAEVFDKDIMEDIDAFVKKESKSFEHTMRDEVNTKVNASYQPWKELVASHPTKKRLQNYCNKVVAEADNSLLDLLQTRIEETNKFISNCINKHNNDRARALTIMKERLIKLSSDEETKAQELKKIAEELAVAQFIANETSLDI